MFKIALTFSACVRDCVFFFLISRRDILNMKTTLRCRILLAVTIAILPPLSQSAQLAPYPPVARLDPVLLEQVFGDQPLQQASAVSPITAREINSTGTLLDLDYWDDYETFSPSSLEYDEFDWTFMKRVASSTYGNMLISPLSVKLTLAILKEAATGMTASEIQTVLGLPFDRKDARAKFSKIIGSLETKSNQYVLDLGSRIYVGENVKARQKFSAVAEEFYKTEIRNTDFDHPKMATNEINGWVSKITHNKITKLLSEDDVSGVVMIVLNAIYFKGSWRNQFKANETIPGHFINENFNRVPVFFMNLQENFFFCKSDSLDATILRLPYLGQKFAMYIILPNTITGVTHVVSNLNSFQLRRDILLMRERSVRLSLPRFRFEYLVQLKEILRDMGIRQAFEFKASFPGISRGQTLDDRLRVSSIRQKAGIEVNEQGSVAYATTEVSLVNKFGDAEEELIEFNVNRPFVFFIEDEITRQILFVGKVLDPLEPIGNSQELPLQTTKT